MTEFFINYRKISDFPICRIISMDVKNTKYPRIAKKVQEMDFHQRLPPFGNISKSQK
jgi:hypothetical protein